MKNDKNTSWENEYSDVFYEINSKLDSIKSEEALREGDFDYEEIEEFNVIDNMYKEQIEFEEDEENDYDEDDIEYSALNGKYKEEDDMAYLSDEEEEETFGGDPTSMYTRAYQGTASLKTNGNSVYFNVGSRFDKIDAIRVRRGKCNVSVGSAKTVSIFRKGNFKGECKLYIWGHKKSDKRKGTKYVKLFVHFK